MIFLTQIVSLRHFHLGSIHRKLLDKARIRTRGKPFLVLQNIELNCQTAQEPNVGCSSI